MKNRFKEREGHFVKGKGWVCDEKEYYHPEKNGSSNGNYTAMEFSQKAPVKPAAEPRVTSRFKSMKQPRTRAPRITKPMPRLR